MTTFKGPPAPAKAKRFRDRAEECCALARMMPSAAHAAVYLNLAETYERLAKQEEWLARDIVTPNIKRVGGRTFSISVRLATSGNSFTAGFEIGYPISLSPEPMP